MARRWRCPPETLAPPWATWRLEPLGHLLDELAALGDLEVVPQPLLGRLVVAVAQVVRHRAAEEERLLRHEADPAPQVLLRELADVHPVHEHGAARRLVEARDEADQRRLAAAGAADDGGGLARPRREGDAAQHRLLGAGVAELHVAELDEAGLGHVLGRPLRVDDARLDVQHLHDALRRDGGARHHHEHERRHEHREQDHEHVLQEGGEVADGHAAVGDLLAAEPHDGDGREVHDERDGREHHREQPSDLERGVGQVLGWRRRSASPRRPSCRRRG